MPRQIEAGLQEAIVRYLRLTLRDCLVYHTPNGGRRSFKTAKLMKRIGTFSGVFDLTILAPGGRTFFIEVKSGKGQLSPEQNAFKLALISLGFSYVVARSLDDVQTALVQWGLNRSARNAVVNGNNELFGPAGGQDGSPTGKRTARVGDHPKEA